MNTVEHLYKPNFYVLDGGAALLPVGALGVSIYSTHPDDNNGFTWKGNDALIAQDNALRAAVA